MNQSAFYSNIKSAAISLLVIACLCSQWVVVIPAGAEQLQHQNGVSAISTIIGGCPIFPANNIWNTPIDNLPVHPRSDQWVNTIGRNTGFHMDFGSGTWDGGPIGIPYNIVGGNVPKVSVSFYYPNESDNGPYPIPINPLIEYGSDHHILILDNSTCTLYELYDASYSGGAWHAGSGAIWSLNSNALRPDTWTSADAAGLPILPGLVSYDEILSGHINHAIRFTAANTNGYIWPARHLTSNNPGALQIPPMGARFRLKASFNISGYPSAMQIILNAMKTYGIILADNGSNWYVSGAPDARWDNDMLHLLDDLTGNDFEAVDESGLMVNYDSGATGSTVSGNAGIAGVTLSYTDGTPKTATSLTDGSYSFPVSYNWSGTVIPSHPCFTFSPISQSYNSITTNQIAQNYAPTLNPASGCADINIRVGGANQGRFGLPSQGSIRTNFSGLNNGPVKIASTNSMSLIGAERVIYNVNRAPTSFTEMMALPASQLDNSYWMPWYNNVDLDTQLRFGNVSNMPAEVHVWIGGQEMTSGCTTTPANVPYPYVLAVGASLRVSCPGVNNGPVQIISNQNIVAAERVIYNVNGMPTSFTEMMGLPDSQLDNTYWLPWYNNVDLDTQLRFGNVSNTDATVQLFIGGQEKTTGCLPSNIPYPYVLAPGASLRVSCPGVNNGPVQIVSDVNIVAAERVIYKVNNIPTSFSEMMALPNSQLDNTYWMPWYNNVDLDTQLRFGNVSNTDATVQVWIGGQEKTSGCLPSNIPYPYVLAPGASLRVSCPGVNNGPVQIISNQNIVAAERVIYKVNNLPTSFSELMALPASQLDNTYWMPWYNNVDLDTQLRFGVP